MTEHLGAKQLARPTVTGDANRQLVGAGVVRRVIPHFRLHRERIKARQPRLRIAQTRSRDRDIENLDHLSTNTSLENPLATDGVFPRHAPLLVGGRSQGQVRRGLQDPVPGLDAITRCVHVGNIGSHPAIDPNGSLLTRLDPGFDSQTRVGHHAGRDQHQVRRAADAAGAANQQTILVHTRYVRPPRPRGP
jgi:hypothetical protein